MRNENFSLRIAVLLVLLVVSMFSFASASTAIEGYIEVEGVVYPEEGRSLNQMRRIAIMDGYRYLAERTDTLYVNSTSTVRDLRDLDEAINTKVEAALRGAEVVSVTREVDGSFHAVVRIPIYGKSKSLAGAVLKEDVRMEDFPKPKFTNIRSEVNRNEIHYTGLVIDCRGLNLSSAVTPAIKSVGGIEIYAYKNIGYQNAVGKGLVEYSSDLNATRAGTTPLVIKAVKISGSCDVVVSDEDAEKILSANQSSNILINCAVDRKSVV